jgi:ligand-binding SRPBCC domain-containing protein
LHLRMSILPRRLGWAMVTIRLSTWVNAPVDRCFRLATSAEFHAPDRSPGKVHSSRSGSLQVGDTVSCRAWRWGLRLSHTCRIDEVRPNTYFREVAVPGSFQHFVHEHHFTPINDGTRMHDEIQFAAPPGPIGFLMERLLLKRYVLKLAMEQNRRLKRAAESTEWRTFLHGELDSVRGTGNRAKVAKMQKYA